MAIKSKNTNLPANFFVGLVSWASFICLIYSFSCFVAGLILVLVQSRHSETVQKFMQTMPHISDLPFEFLARGASIFLLFFISLALTIVFRKERKAFEKSFASFISHVWVEVKIVLLPIAVYLISLVGVFWLTLFAVITAIFILCVDISYNNSFFKCNIANSILNTINHAKKGSKYEYTSIKRFISVVALNLGIILFDVLIMSGIQHFQELGILSDKSELQIGVPVLLFSICGIIGSIVWYYLAFKEDLEDLSKIMLQIEKMYSGNLKAENQIPPTSKFYDMGMQLNMIRTGIETAVAEGIKADKTKVELITNVSHDIKTPLTSIISYVELLKKEASLPPHVQDYVQTISNKANRLSHIVQDIFEVSKAATGNLALSLDIIDLGKLVQQTLAEMQETMLSVNITWRTEITDEALMIKADGQKLYRVFQNLIRNCAQYALEGSRAYITLKNENDFAEFSIRNVAKTELDSSAAEYLTGRFIRGDNNRTTEGSGLGLSIAKSFAEACGGTFRIITDGDIFFVKINFPIYKDVEEIKLTAENIV